MSILPIKADLLANDARYRGLCDGLRQLSVQHLRRLLKHIDNDGDLVLDDVNYKDGVYCPLAVAVGLPDWVLNPSHEHVYAILALAGFAVNNTRGLNGDFYTTNRRRDLRIAATDVLDEMLQEQETEDDFDGDNYN